MTSPDPLGLAAFYDLFFSDPLLSAFFGDSQYANFGFWTADNRDAHAASDNLVDVVASQIPHPAGRLLDVACGRGASSDRLQSTLSVDEVMAINLDPAQLAEAARRFPGPRYAAMDAARLAFDDRSFDQVVSIEAAFHFRTRQRFFEEAWRVLTPGGCLVMSDILMARGAPMVPAENHLPDLDAYAGGLRNAGFHNVRVEDITGQTWRPFRRQFTRFVSRNTRRMWDPLSWRSLYTLNVNGAWAVRAVVLVFAERPGGQTSSARA